MPGRRWSDGLHEAVEAKEGVKIASENQTLATITLQNYFRMYDKLAGMTGHRGHRGRGVRQDLRARRHRHPDQPAAAPRQPPGRRLQDRAREVRRGDRRDRGAATRKGQPVLVGTVSIEKSERLSKLLKKRGHPPPGAQRQVPRARGRDRGPGRAREGGHHRHQHGGARHRHPARRQPGLPGQGAPAGRRASIPPPRPPEAREAAWHEAKKAHRARARAGGRSSAACTSSAPSATSRGASTTSSAAARAARATPGSSRFYLSLEDDLLRIFGSERIQRIMDRLGMEEGEPIEHKLVTRAIGTAQKRVETRNFEIRKHLLEYDDVMNKQREIVYGLRREILDGREPGGDRARVGRRAGRAAVVERYAPADAHPEDWDLAGLNEALHRQFDFRLPADEVDELAVARRPRRAGHRARSSATTASARAELGPEMFHRLERWIILGLRWEDGEFRGHQPALARAPAEHGPPEGGHRPPRLRPARPADRVQEGSLRHVPGDDRPPEGGRSVEQLFKVRMAREDARAEPRRAAPAPALAGTSRGRDRHARRGRPAPARPEPRTADGREGRPQRSVPCGSGKKYKKCCLLKGA